MTNNPAAIACLLATLALGSAGCVELEDHLTIHADGSGTVVITSRLLTDTPPQAMAMMFAVTGETPPPEANYPALIESQARLLFPGDAFELETKIVPDAEADAARFVANVRFKSIDALLASPYAAARSLAITRTAEGKLIVRSTTGLRPIAAYTPPKAAPGEAAEDDDDFIPAQADEARAARGKIKATFRLTLPAAPATDDPDTAVRGNTVTWTIDGPAVADEAKLAEALWRVLTASCEAGDTKIDSPGPARLDLMPYAELTAGETGVAAVAVDDRAVLKAARVTPLALSVSRSFDIAGEGFYGQNGAVILVAVTLPTDLAPQRWGQLALTEATDNLGRSLLRPAGDDDDYRFRYYSTHEDTGPRIRDGRIVHLLTVNLKPPALEAVSIRKLAGSIDLSYPGAPYIVKIDQAIKADDITAEADAEAFFDEDEGEPLKSPSLAAIGASWSILSTHRARGLTILTIGTDGAAAARWQVFDAAGRPWPTFLSGSEDAEMAHAVVIGDPEPPLSVGAIVSGGGAKLKLPIELSDLPVQQPAPEAKETSP